MPEPLNFQSIIMTLQHFWAEQGCLIWQPYNVQVGAGTYNPATSLRVLGPEPWKVAYVEPSIRPDDARYGENPNRMQMHYQFQVILKPDPGNPQEIYLHSLQALGIDPHEHDIRFVEDKWESPALGAWGLGWEVWLDGQEITQYTYFQQAGNQLLDPVSVEITYGLDRIAIALQRARGFTEIRWNDTFTAGDINLQAEQEHSKYYFEIADVERLRQVYDLYEQEAETALQHDLVLPAHDYILKCSHTFNVLDSRGAVGVTERQTFFGRMRDLSRRVAEAYLTQRQHLEYPWLDESIVVVRELAAQPSPSLAYPAESAPFLLEIGTEELPVADLDGAIDQLGLKVTEMLASLRLDHGEVRVQGTPRRLVVFINTLSPRQDDLEQLVKGPPAARAFDAFGDPTPASVGFARSKGLSVEDLQTVEMDGGSYVAAVIHERGQLAGEVLAAALPALIESLRFDKPIRWNYTNEAFSRPIRWLLALHGESVIPFEYAGVRSGGSTRGLRFQEPIEITVRSVQEYFLVLAAQGILLDLEERRLNIRAQVEVIAAQVGGQVADDPALFAEVANLVEAPHALRGSFDPQHLQLPKEVLISVMKKHQRYFPVQRDGELLPYFITVANKPEHDSSRTQSYDLIVEGNEHVIRARFADAAFFVHEDLKTPLEGYLPRLNQLIFQNKLGSMLDKTQRLVPLASALAESLALDESQQQVVKRTAELCKADLVTKMVVEMTSLQGYMGRYYALQSGETQLVADAIYEHYLPRFSGDELPSSLPGIVLGLADRLDTLAGLFAAGVTPTGARDPFAQRRAALGMVQLLIAHDLDFNLRSALQQAAAQLPIAANVESQERCLEFIIARLRNLLLDEGWHYDVVDAVLAAQGENPARAEKAVRQLAAWVERPDWRSILPAYARCVRITRDLAERYPVDPGKFVEEHTRVLYTALLEAEQAPREPGSADDFLNAFMPMIPAINHFFDTVLVMTEDEILRLNRLGLLQRISALAHGVADMSRLEGF
jgi:glycyl-tRNA synthetase